MKTTLHFLALILILICIGTTNVAGQVAVSLDNNPADASAMLDVRSTSKGMLIPRMTSAQRNLITSPASGLLVFDNTTASFWFYNGVAWTELVDGASNKIADADNDTRVEVEQQPDEDKIRFTIAGTEYFRMEPGRIHTSNTGGSVRIGHVAGAQENLFDRHSVAIGDSVLYHNGYNSLYYHSTFNTAAGARSMLFNTTGFFNSAFGSSALRKNTTGERNTGIGVFALQNNTTGMHNTAVGVEALNVNTTGTGNTALGYRAGAEAMGTNNVFIGREAGNYEQGNDKLYIDNSPIEQPLIYGDFATDSMVVHGKLAFTTDGTGNAVGVVARDSENVLQHMSYTRLLDSLAAHGLTMGGSDEDWLIEGGLPPIGNNTHIYHEDSVTIGSTVLDGTGMLNLNGRLDVAYTNPSSFAIGTNALNQASTGIANIAIGDNSLMANTTGYQNTAIGRFALEANTEGSRNSAVGDSSLHFNTTGYGNTANGVSALQNNTGGFYSTSTGYQSLTSNTTGSQNTATGYRALFANTTGFLNVANGVNSLSSNTSGAFNTAVGHWSMRYNTTGAGNVAIGTYAMQYHTVGDFNSAIGYEAL